MNDVLVELYMNMFTSQQGRLKNVQSEQMNLIIRHYLLKNLVYVYSSVSLRNFTSR